MAVYLVTGRLGSGKSLAAVRQAREYAMKGRRVVANFHLDLSSLARRSGSKLASSYAEVIPARPSHLELEALGRGGAGEHDAGLLILDECGTFLNSRQWQGTDRQKVLEWFLHTRKLGWDLLLIVQHAAMLDKQVRDSICEYLVTVRRLDKMKFPVISWLLPFVRMPQLHVASVRYGMGPHDPMADHWVFRGKELYPCYDTQWISAAGDTGPYCTLSAELSRFRYKKKFDWGFASSLVWRLPLFVMCRLFQRCGLLRESHFLGRARRGFRRIEAS